MARRRRRRKRGGEDEAEEEQGPEQATPPLAPAPAPRMRASDMTDERMAQIVSGLE